MTLPLASLVPVSAFVFGLAGWTVHHFASPGISFHIKFLVAISFWLGFNGIALLPIDLQITTVYPDDDDAGSFTDDATQTQNQRFLSSLSHPNTPNETYIPWVLTYLSTFVVGFGVLPIVREGLLSGQFTFKTRANVGCRNALRRYAWQLFAGIIALIALTVHLGTIKIIPLLMALGNTYGLLLVLLLLGYGLVDLPRSIWRSSNAAMELRRRHIMAGNADEALFEAVWELQDCETLVDDVASKSPVDDATSADDPCYATCLEKLVALRKSTATLSMDLERRRTRGNRQRSSSNGDDHVDGLLKEDVQSVEYLAKLNARLQNAQADVISAESRWKLLVETTLFYESLANGTVAPPEVVLTNSSDSLWTKIKASFDTINNRIYYIWLTKLRGSSLRLLGMFTAGLSSIVLWSEATLSLPVSLSPFAWVLDILDKTDDNGDKGFLFQLAALIPLMYIAMCMYSSIFKMSVFGSYRLRGVKQSTAVALVFNAQYLVRLQFPLAYNYLLMIKYDVNNSNCAFSHVMNNMSTVPFLGTSFSVYAPLLIILLCALTLFNVYARILVACGFEHEDAILFDNKESLDEKANEGITLVQRHTERNNSNNDNTSVSSPTSSQARPTIQKKKSYNYSLV